VGNHSDDDDLPSWTDLGGDDQDDDFDFPEFADGPVAPGGVGGAVPVTPDTGSEARDFAGLEDNPFVAAALERPRPRRLLYAGVAAAIVVVAVAIGLIVWLTTRSSGSSAPAKAAPAASSAVSTTAPAPASCPSATQGGITTGNTAGGVDSGPAAIMAFDYGYYVKRSGQAARQVVAADARVGTAAEIQSGIDKLAPGTTHCLKITSRGDGLWGVELTQTPPNGAAPVVIKQQIQTVDSGGRTWISSIVPDPQS